MQTTQPEISWLRLRAWFSGQFYAILPGLVGLVVAMSIAASRWPEPHMHDDFGNLLVASTLLEGRFSNPVPRAWQSLETFHVILQPTYASKYPIGLGAMLAIGKSCFGAYAAGLWLVAGFAAWSISWMVAGHLPRRWAGFAGLFTATHPYWQNGWSQEYTNGWLSVAGVALVLGGLLRVRRRARNPKFAVQPAAVAIAMIGLGCVLSLFSRPFEGGLVCGLLGLLFVPTWISRGLCLSHRFWLSAGAGTSILVSGIFVQVWINHSITGQWSQLPYQLHEMQYGVAPVLIWQKPHEPSLGHRFEEQVKFHRGWSMDAYTMASSWKGYFAMLQRRVISLMNHWGTMVACAPICLALLRRERQRWIGLVGVLLIALLVINCIPWSVPQYVSPMLPVAMFVACCSARGLIQRIAMRFQGFRVASLESMLFLSILLLQCSSLIGIAHSRWDRGAGWETTWAERRAEIQNQLDSLPGNDLVLVRYPTGHDVVNQEWVFNEANIEKTGVLWARWGSRELNHDLRGCYPERTHWLLEFGNGVPSLRMLAPE